MSVIYNSQQKVIKIVQELLLDEGPQVAITPSLISEKIDMVTNMNPKWKDALDRQVVTDELIRRFSLWIGHDSTLASDTGHIQWLTSAKKKDWRYWPRYRTLLERKLSPHVIDRLDESTDTVLGLLEEPEREGPWDRRGLVVGHVQSGKTGHYTGVICKAADAGYKIIIVLAGLHNNLRAQTQIRLDEGFLGYETAPNAESKKPVGVGEIDGDPRIQPNYVTNRSEKGDFNTTVARNLGITPEQRPWLFVVKKNKTVLERLLRWITNHVANTHDQETGRRIVTNLPLLIIDDEADNASVDTGEQVFKDDGIPDEEHQPTAINKLIRGILHSFTRSAYVGYTATPFANIFIHERGETRDEGSDLFPSAFIHNLSAPSNYIGPSQVFGTFADEDEAKSLLLVRTVNDFVNKDGKTGWMPQKHKNGHIPLFEGQDALPESLEEAVLAFFLSCAARKLRGQENEHSSMLVHVTRFNNVQTNVFRQVDDFVRHARQRLNRRIDHENLMNRLEKLWNRDFIPTTQKVHAQYPDPVLEQDISWEEISSVLADTVSDIQVRTINGTAKDALDYAEHEGTGLKVIAIGGDKLARGLTLEGLSVSYFLRASRMYDTLMQMGRWFGYRPSYQDLCRLYTTIDLVDWFGHIADAAEELREEFELMAASGGTPREYGLKVASHPVLMVTSRLKMRSAKTLYLSFSGQLLETVALYRDPNLLRQNLENATGLIAALGKPESSPIIRIRNGSRQEWKGFLWENVPSSHVIDFLSRYRTHPEAYKVDSQMLTDFIISLNSVGELTKWTIVLIGGRDGGSHTFQEGITIQMLKRTQKPSNSSERYSIGRLMSSRDEAIDLDENAWNAALELTRAAWSADPARSRRAKQEPEAPNGPAIRKIRGFGADGIPPAPERGVLFLYVLDPDMAEAGFPDDTPPVVAFGISFPGSSSGKKVEYKANNVFWEQEYGSAE